MVNLDCRWSLPPAGLALACGEVHVWFASLDQQSVPVVELTRLLAADERARAERFHFERDHRRFIVGRAALRMVLARYLNGLPEAVQFVYNRHGKPALARKAGQPELARDLEFNLCHSHEMALCAVTRGRGIGIDVELMRPLPDARDIAARFFSRREYEGLCEQPEELQPFAFFNCWTRKEAYIKAIGDGLSRPLDKFEVSLAPGDPARLLWVEGQPGETARWSLAGFLPADGYVAAVALEGPISSASWWRWQPEDMGVRSTTGRSRIAAQTAEEVKSNG